jgi:hypothetical protein
MGHAVNLEVLKKHLPRTVGIVGIARAGKDSSGAVLTRHYGYTRFASADPLKDLALALDPQVYGASGYDENLAAVVEKVGWEIAKDEYPDARAYLIKLGMAAREVFGPDFWIARTLERVSAHDGFAVITDVRFVNEAAAIRAFDPRAIIMRVERTDVEPASKFESEVAQVEVDGVISNNGDLGDLDFVVRQAFLDALIRRSGRDLAA